MNIKLVIFWIALSIINCESTSSDFCPAKSLTKRDTIFVTMGTYGGNDKFGSFYKKVYYSPRYVRGNWLEAKLMCSAYNMELASFKTLDEVNAALTMLNTALNSDWFYVDGIALKSKSPTEWYSTETGDKLDYAIPWMPTQPDNLGGDEYFLSLERVGGMTLFNDVKVRGPMQSFLCQKYI